MRHGTVSRPSRVLLTLDAVGGVWSYTLDLAAMLAGLGIEPRLVGFGPEPSAAMAEAAEAIDGVSLVWTGEPLDWMVEDEAALDGVAPAIHGLAQAWQADLVHVSALSQAAGLPPGPPVVAHAHSCVPSWWDAVRGGPLPSAWLWQRGRNRRGLARADIVLAPSASHGRALAGIYGPLGDLRVVPGAAAVEPVAWHVPAEARKPYVFAAGRWWDEGKNAALLDEAARLSPWPIAMAGALHGPNGVSARVAHATALGQLDACAMQDHLRQAALFAAPSRYEPFGLAVLEAASRGTPLLLADIATFRELWEGAAIFLDPGDPVAWAAAIEEVAGDASARAAMGRRACERAAAFPAGRQRAALLAAYASALDAHAMPAEGIA